LTFFIGEKLIDRTRISPEKFLQKEICCDAEVALTGDVTASGFPLIAKIQA
jgi:hypothetical protein